MTPFLCTLFTGLCLGFIIGYFAAIALRAVDDEFEKGSK